MTERLLDAAEAEIVEHGSTEISLRAVARRAGVSHQAPGFAFSDRAGLLAALAARGYGTLDAAIMAARDAQAPSTPGRVVLAEMGVAYVLATARRPALFWLLARPDVGREHAELDRARRAAVNTLLGAVRGAQADGWRPNAGERQLAALAWATVHGLSGLYGEALRDLAEPSLEATARAVLGELFA